MKFFWLGICFCCFFGILAEGIASGGVLDFADLIISEEESNDSVAEAQDLGQHFNDEVLAIGVEGNLSEISDVDVYGFPLAENGQIALKFQVLEGSDKEITVLAAGSDNRAYFVADDNIWMVGLVGSEGSEGSDNSEDKPVFMVSEDDLAGALGLSAGADLTINDMAVVPEPNGLVLIALGGEELSGGGNVLAFNPVSSEITLEVTAEQIKEVTSQDELELAAIAVDPEGRIYLAEQVSGAVLVLDLQPGGDYDISIFTAGETLSVTVQDEITEELEDGITRMPSTVIAQAQGDFQVNALVLGEGGYGLDGFDVFYLSQLGEDFNGDGSITRVRIKRDDPNTVLIDKFFEPDENQLELNPSALVLDESGAGVFGNKMYMGTFGASLGDDFDGLVYVVDENGVISSFVTGFVDRDGQPVEMGGNVVDGFFDVTDMAFPPSMTGPYGEYLYVLSENIDSNGDEPDGFNSDLWRIGPDGIAELFAPDIADGVISLAFGNLHYGSDLFVATFDGGVGAGKVLRVDSDGNVETFYDLGQFSGSLSVSDLAFAPLVLPVASPMEGKMVLTIKSGASAFLVQLESDIGLGEFPIIWTSDLQTGDVSSGDIVFDNESNLIIAHQQDKSLVRMEYLTVFDYAFGDLQIRPDVQIVEEEDEDDEEDEEDEEEELLGYTPYTLVSVADRPRIIRLSDSGDFEDIATEVKPSVLDLGEVPEDGSKNVAFAFDDGGDVLVFIQNIGSLRRGERSEEGDFAQFDTLLNIQAIDAATSLTDAQISHIAWSPEGSLFARGSNGTQAPEGEDPPIQEFDDTILLLGNTATENFSPEELVQISELTRMSVRVDGPEESVEFIAQAGGVLDESLQELTGGDYTVTVESLENSSGDYDLLISLGGELQREIEVSAATGPAELVNADGESFRLSYTGPGWATLLVNQKPSGTIIEMLSLTITQSKPASTVTLDNLDNPSNMVLDEVILGGSLGRLEYKGSLNTLKTQSAKVATVRDVVLGDVRDVDGGSYLFIDFQARSLGDAEIANRLFNALQVRSLRVDGDINNVEFLRDDSRNYCQEIMIGGVVNNSTFNGSRINLLRVKNNQAEETAILESTFEMTGSRSRLEHVQVDQGDVVDSVFTAQKKIGSFEVVNGSLRGTTISTLGTGGQILSVFAGTTSAEDEDSDNGSIIDSSIRTQRLINRIHADGDITGSTISAGGLFSSKINRLSCGGNCSASIDSTMIKKVLVGFDRKGNRLGEDEDFTGSDFSGSISVILGLKELNVTGKITNATLNANSFSGFGVITSIFAEDGFEDTTISVNRFVRRIMVGYEDGRRNKPVNEQADVSGTITAGVLGRIYYTGSEDVDLSGVRHLGPVIDDVPDN